MEAYQQDELADSEKDAIQIQEAEKAVELKSRHKRKHGSNKEKMDPQQPSGFRPPQFSGSSGFPPPIPFMPPPFNQPVPVPRPVGPSVRVPGTCFQCLQIGHLKAHCPNKINKQYPLNDVLVSSVQIGVNRCSDKVCNASLHVSKSQSDQLSLIDHIKGSSGRVQPGDVHVENAGLGYKMGKGPAVYSSAADNPGFVDSIDDGPETI